MSTEEKLFTIYDYVMFVGLVVISMIIGVVAGVKGFKNATTKDFFLGGKDMHPIPISMSLIGGVISALSVLGNPTEIYLHGTQLWLNLLGSLWGSFVIIYVILPVLYPLDLISMMQYLELRYNSRFLRKLGSVSQLFSFCLYLGICLYTPALALSSVTRLPNWISVTVLGLVCTFYISIGGVKAVVYTDVFQTSIMFIGVLVVIIQVCLELGGIANVFEIADRGQRIEFLNFDTSPFARHTFWSVQVLGMYFIVSTVGISQPQFQRLVSVRSLKISQTLCVVFFFGLVLLWSLFNLSGLAAYAVYADCDPLQNNQIERPDQIIPYLVADKLGHFPGMTGLFVAAVYGAVLSSISSQANAFAALMWEDFLSEWKAFINLFRCDSTHVTRIISAIAGLLSILFAFILGNLGTVFQTAYSVVGAAISPLDGLFIVGIVAPWVEKKGAACGFITAFIFNVWFVIGKYINEGGKVDPLPLSTSGCNRSHLPVDTYSSPNGTKLYDESYILSTESPYNEMDSRGYNDVGHEHTLYDISYCYVGSIGVLIVLIVSSVVSLCLGPNPPENMEEALIYKPSFKLYKILWKAKSRNERSNSTVNDESRVRSTDSLS